MIGALLSRLTRWYFTHYLAPLVDERIKAAQQPAAPVTRTKQYIGDLN